MQTIVPKTRDLVLIGGGHTHALILRRWGMNPMPEVQLTVIDPTPVTAYSGMLPGFVAGHYDFSDLEIDLVRLTRFAGARLIIGPAIGLDPEVQTIEVAGRAPISYDIASLDIGITTHMPDLPGFSQHGVPAKPLGAFAARWNAYVEAVQRGMHPAQVVIIGGGIAGVELALTMHHRLSAQTERAPEITVIDRGLALSGVSARSARILRRRLEDCAIALVEQAAITHVSETGVALSDGREIAARFVVGAAGATPTSWIAQTGLSEHNGFVAVDANLRSLSHDTVFAAGDCAHLSASPRPKAGVFAVRAAPVLDQNLRAQLAGQSLRPFRPQSSYLKLVSLGPKEALAQKGPLSVASPTMWHWKDHIDRSFMEKLQVLPMMSSTNAQETNTPLEQLCGGCGSKVAPGALTQALGSLPSQTVPGLVTGQGDDAAVLAAPDGWQVISTDHMRAVVHDPVCMTRIACLHAMGDVWAMGAKPQIALAQITIPRMSELLQARTIREITTAASECCAAEGAALAGGHSTMGAELTIGFTVTGLCDRPPILKSGAQPGDILILTRPLGSGTLLAAEMQGKARGAWIARLLETLTTSQGKAAAILAQKAHAMTDVTGFGLAGHVLEVARASNVGISLELRDIPIFDGAAELTRAGVRSTVFEGNKSAHLSAIEAQHTSEQFDLLFDPQTCGGLLAAIPAQTAIEAVATIASTGTQAWVIGQVTDGPPRIAIQ